MQKIDSPKKTPWLGLLPAYNGLVVFWKKEPKARIHTFAALIVFVMGFWFKLSALEWIAIAIVAGSVFAMEIVNTAIENMCDFICPTQNTYIGNIKDLSAAAVLFTSIIALITGCIIFIPKVLYLLF